MNEHQHATYKTTIAYGVGVLVRDHEDTPGAVKYHVQPMLEEYEEAYTQALITIATLKESLRNINLTASKAGNEPGAALAWIESETSRVLKATLEALA